MGRDLLFYHGDGKYAVGHIENGDYAQTYPKLEGGQNVPEGIDPPSGQIDRRLTEGWHIVPVGDHVLFYRATDGIYAVGRIENGDFVQTSPGPGTGFAKGWTHIVPVGDHVLFYRATDGIYAVGRIENGDFKQTGAGAGFTAGWTHIMPIEDRVLFYRAVDGVSAVGRIENGQLRTRAGNALTKGWSHIVPLGDHVLFYRAVDGFYAVGRIENEELWTHAGNALTARWSHIVPLGDHLLFYRAVDGIYAVGRIENGDFVQTHAGEGLTVRWSHIVPAGDHVLFYQAFNGFYAVGRIENGDYAETRAGAGFNKGWTYIVPVGGLVSFYMAVYPLVPSPAQDCESLESSTLSWVGYREPWSNYGIIDSDETFFGFLPAQKLFRPANQYELARVIRGDVELAGKTARALGSGWDFSQAVLPQETPIEDQDENYNEATLLGVWEEGELHYHARSFLTRHFGYAIDTTGLKRSLQDSLQNILADGRDPDEFVFIEAGMTVDYLNRLLNAGNPPRALRTMGGAAAQTIAGAFSTGTHGGDFDRPPLADAVRAIYLVGAGGIHHWIEPAAPLTDETKLRKTFPCLKETIHYDDDLFRSVLVSFGAMGVIYAVILDVGPQYSLLQWNKWSTWEKFKEEAEPDAYESLFNGAWTGLREYLLTEPRAQKPPRFAQIVINPIRNDDRTHSCYVSNRAELPLQQKQGVQWLSSYLNISDEDVLAAIQKDEDHYDDFKGYHLLPLKTQQGSTAEKMTALLRICKEHGYDWAVRDVIDLVMQKTFPEPGEPPDPSIDVGYIVMAGSGVTQRGFPTLGGTAVEAAFSFFRTVPGENQPGLKHVVRDAISFVDEVLEVFDRRVNVDKQLPAGWLSLRVTGRTEAFLGMERFERTGTVELVLVGRPDGYDIVREIEQRAIAAGGILHWGQSNGMVRSLDLEGAYGSERLEKWKVAQRVLGGNTFVNLFMRRCGLV